MSGRYVSVYWWEGAGGGAFGKQKIKDREKRTPISDFDLSWKKREKVRAQAVVKNRKRTLFNSSSYGIYVFIRGFYAAGNGVRIGGRS